MKRRDFITLLGGAVAWPLAAGAQQPAMPVVGHVHSGSANDWALFVTAFREGLKEAGYVEGQNVAIEFHWAEHQTGRLPSMVADLVSRQVAVIVTNTPAALAAKAATTTIPIVFGSGADPVKLGLVASLNRPGGNLTGVSFYSNDLEAKRLGLLHELIPKATVVAALANPNFPDTADRLRELQEAAPTLGKQIRVVNAATVSEIDAAFASFAQQRPDALIVVADPFMTARRYQLTALAMRHALPAIYAEREQVLGLIETSRRHEKAGDAACPRAVERRLTLARLEAVEVTVRIDDAGERCSAHRTRVPGGTSRSGWSSTASPSCEAARTIPCD